MFTIGSFKTVNGTRIMRNAQCVIFFVRGFHYELRITNYELRFKTVNGMRGRATCLN